MFKTLLVAAGAMLIAHTALAIEYPVPGRHDGRIRYVNYDPANIVPIWSTPGAVMVIQIAPDERIKEVTAADTDGLWIVPKGSFLFLKFHGCLIPEPMIVVAETPTGMRSYLFQVQTNPQVCETKKTSTDMVNASTQPLDGQNLRYISANALSEGADVDYEVVFKYPGDSAAKRRAEERAALARWKKDEADRILKQTVSFDTKDPYAGNRNLRYMWRGNSGIQPRWVWDNGYSTLFVFPGLQRMPTLYFVGPDGKEATADYSIKGDTLIAIGTQREWRIRDGDVAVAEIIDLSWNPVGSTTNTGTASPYVQRIIKGEE